MNKKVLAIFWPLAIILILIVLVFVFLIFKPQPKPPEPPGEPPIVNPEGRAAFKYYPKGGNAPDFREGSNGNFLVELERKDNKIILSWPEEIKIVNVKVIDIGKIWNLKDHQIVWGVQNYDPNQPSTGPTSQAYINPPYELGNKPEGFFLLKGVNNIFQASEGRRYSVEILGLNEKNLPVLGVYTFDY
jgi:hypothetical protein